MKHADDEALDRLEPLLAELRATPGLREVSRGRFYRDSKAFLHFHSDPAGLFADVRLGTEFERRSVTTSEERATLLEQVRNAL